MEGVSLERKPGIMKRATAASCVKKTRFKTSAGFGLEENQTPRAGRTETNLAFLG